MAIVCSAPRPAIAALCAGCAGRSLPASSVVAAVIIVATFFNPFKLIAAFPIDLGKVSLSGTKITMESPRVGGFTSDARSYELTASAAAQDVTKPEFLELKGINAKVQLKDGQRVQLKAQNGLYNTKSEILKLRDEILLSTTSGYEGHLTEATVETGTGHIVSDSPMEMKLLNGGTAQREPSRGRQQRRPDHVQRRSRAAAQSGDQEQSISVEESGRESDVRQRSSSQR